MIFQSIKKSQKPIIKDSSSKKYLNASKKLRNLKILSISLKRSFAKMHNKTFVKESEKFKCKHKAESPNHEEIKN